MKPELLVSSGEQQQSGNEAFLKVLTVYPSQGNFTECSLIVLCSGMRGDQARKVCPEVQLVQVPTAHGKADLTLYRDAGKQVCALLNDP